MGFPWLIKVIIWILMVNNDLVGGFNLPLVGNILLILMVNINGYYMYNDG